MNLIGQNPMTQPIDRRQFITASAGAFAAASLSSGEEVERIRGQAEHCIFLWLGGGMAQIDTFDPKRLGDPATRYAGSAYPAIPTAVSGVHVTEHLRRT